MRYFMRHITHRNRIIRFSRSFMDTRQPPTWTITRPDVDGSIVSETRSERLKDTKRSSSPKAVVLLIGWWGAKAKDIAKYSTLYHGLMPCVTVAGVADSTDIMFKRDESLHRFSQNGLEVVGNLLAEHDALKLPVVVHLFSNGGGYVWQHMSRVLEQDDHEYSSSKAANECAVTMTDAGEAPLKKEARFSQVRTSLQALIMDSCPAYPKVASGMAALEGSLNGKSPFLLPILKVMFLLFNSATALWHWLWRRPRPAQQFWNDLLTSTLETPQAFVYSTVDTMVDYNHLEDYIEARRAHASHVSVLKFTDTPHVQHYRYYPNDYKTFIEQFLTQHLH